MSTGDFKLQGFSSSSEGVIRSAITRLKISSPRLYEYVRRYISKLICVETNEKHSVFIDPSWLASEKRQQLVKEFQVIGSVVGQARVEEIRESGVRMSDWDLIVESATFSLQAYDECEWDIPDEQKDLFELMRKMWEDEVQNLIQQRERSKSIPVGRGFDFRGFDLDTERTAWNAMRRLEQCTSQLYQYVQVYIADIIVSEDTPPRHTAAIPRSWVNAKVSQVIKEFSIMYFVVYYAHVNEEIERGVKLASHSNFALDVFDRCKQSLASRRDIEDIANLKAYIMNTLVKFESAIQ